jgi:hypothetical protein
MMRGVVKVFLAFAAVLVLLPAVASAQEGQIAGTVRDSMGAVMPGVTVDVTSPALIEKLRSATTDTNGQYQITNLPVGAYQVTFTLTGFAKQQQSNVQLTSGFTANVNATMGVGQVEETIVVSGAAPVVDVQNAREVISLTGDEIKDLPTSRNVNSLLALTPGINSNYKPTTAFGAPGVCVGGIGVFCNPGVNGFNVGDGDTTNLAQGRVMVDGQVVNSALGTAQPVVGQTGGYTADIANAQEVNIQVSGALGDSETGGATINIVPRTGGNRYAGDFNTTYTTKNWFDRNTSAYPTVPALFQAVINDHDVSGSFGGPIKRDKLWFYTVLRDQGIHKLPVGVDLWPNLNEGKYGFNYQPDRSQDRVEYKNQWRNVNARITWQASARNKFNFFWDEQDFCQDPCHGVVSVFTSPESWWSVSTKPNRLQQVSWTNPLTAKVLLEGGLSYTLQDYSTASHRDYTNYTAIPRIYELGDTVGYDSTCGQPTCADGTTSHVNQFAGTGCIIVPTFCTFPFSVGSLNSYINGGGAETRNVDSYRMRGSWSYVTGSHHAKIGYDGAYFKQAQTNKVNDPQMTFYYNKPAVTCVASLGQCGNTSLQFPNDPNNTALRPIPAFVEYNTGSATLNDKVMYTAFYAQDQWRLKRLTLGGALRFDHATSGYGGTCIGPNQFVKVGYCTSASDGVNYKDFTPRFSAAWDVTGNGKTAVKWNFGKFLNAAGINGVYASANPARRTVNDLIRGWTDTNGNRRVDCDLMNFANNGECGAYVFGFNNTTAFGQDPNSVDASGAPIGLNTIPCGRTESAIPAKLQQYCQAYGDSVVDGWGRRRSEWQFGLGVQRELLPRLSGEFTFNRRKYLNILTSDTLGLGCDRFNGAQDVTTCQQGMLQYSNPSYDFYKAVAPSDPRLPQGGNYTILGLNDAKALGPNPALIGQTYLNTLNYTWAGFDTNFAWRAPKGIRIQGGTSTGRTQRNSCYSELDAPNVRGRVGAEWQAGCDTRNPYQTNISATAAYTIPKVDILVSTVYHSQPGVAITANATYQAATTSAGASQIIWMPDSAARATAPCGLGVAGTGCLGTSRNLTTVVVPLLLNNEMWGERVTTMDLKFLKNVRFSGKRAAIGVDVYNFLNSDAITSYNATYTLDNPATPGVDESKPVSQGGQNHWLEPTGLVSPRFVRLQVTFNF